jgi:hypothetical protein
MLRNCVIISSTGGCVVHDGWQKRKDYKLLSEILEYVNIFGYTYSLTYISLTKIQARKLSKFPLSKIFQFALMNSVCGWCETSLVRRNFLSCWLQPLIFWRNEATLADLCSSERRQRLAYCALEGSASLAKISAVFKF